MTHLFPICRGILVLVAGTVVDDVEVDCSMSAAGFEPEGAIGAVLKQPQAEHEYEPGSSPAKQA